jgi:hypothetical protein
MEREFLQQLGLEEETIDAVLTEHGKTVASFDAQMKQMRFDAMFQNAVQRTGGRNAKAIGALLDLQQLQESEAPEQALDAALQQLKKENAYLFESSLPPRYAPFTGTRQVEPQQENQTLAQALKARFGK